MSMSRVILIAQSRTTGRFLLVHKDDGWHFASSNPKDPELAELHVALNDCKDLTGVSRFDNVTEDSWALDFLLDNPHTIFHVWMDNEPAASPNVQWFHLFDFPEDIHESVHEVLKKDAVIRKTYSLEA